MSQTKTTENKKPLSILSDEDAPDMVNADPLGETAFDLRTSMSEPEESAASDQNKAVGVMVVPEYIKKKLNTPMAVEPIPKDVPKKATELKPVMPEIACDKKVAKKRKPETQAVSEKRKKKKEEDLKSGEVEFPNEWFSKTDSDVDTIGSDTEEEIARQRVVDANEKRVDRRLEEFRKETASSNKILNSRRGNNEKKPIVFLDAGDQKMSHRTKRPGKVYLSSIFRKQQEPFLEAHVSAVIEASVCRCRMRPKPGDKSRKTVFILKTLDEFDREITCLMSADALNLYFHDCEIDIWSEYAADTYSLVDMIVAHCNRDLVAFDAYWEK